MNGVDITFERERDFSPEGKGGSPLESLFGHELVESFGNYYWLAIMYQSGPIDWWLAEMDLGTTVVESLFLEMPEEVEGASAGAVALFERGTFSTFSKYLYYDDTFLVALTDDSAEVMTKAQTAISGLAVSYKASGKDSCLAFWQTIEQLAMAILVFWNQEELTFLGKAADVDAVRGSAVDSGSQVRNADVTTLLRYW